MIRSAGFVGLLACLTLALAQGVPFAIIRPDTLPEAVQGAYYEQDFAASQTVATWQVEGELVPGLGVNPGTGALSGIPAGGGELRLTVVARRADGQEARREYGLHVSGIALRWTQKPALDGATLAASAEVVNDSHAAADLTFIAYGINDVNKAFTLGYQHAALQPGQRLSIPFSATLPAGRYYVHIDAVGEQPPRTIYRSRLETGRDYVVEP